MSILVDRHSRVLVQGITGREGRQHTALMRADGTHVVAGVTPGKAGQTVDGVPVFDTVAQAQAALLPAEQPDWSIGFVPAPFAKAAALEALQAGLNTVVITEHVPVFDELAIHQAAVELGRTAIGPNCPGIITPGGDGRSEATGQHTKLGIMPASVFMPGPVGVISRSGTLTYEVVSHLTQAHIGQSTCVGIGGDPINLFNLQEALLAFEADAATRVIVLIGEIGGAAEERAAHELIGTNVTKPVVAFLAGRTAPPGKRLGHAGAIIEHGAGTVASKQAALVAAGVAVAELPSQVPSLVSARL